MALEIDEQKRSSERVGLSKALENIYHRLFTVNKTDRRWQDVIWWWEARRPAYNAILLVAGILSTAIAIIFLVLPPAPFEKGNAGSPEDIGEPFLAFMFITLIAIVANLCYTLGWIVELPLYWTNGDRPNIGPDLMRVGLCFSLFLMSLPALISFFIWIYRIFN